MKGFIILILSVLFISINASAADKVSVKLQWEPYAEVINTSDGGFISTYTFKGAHHQADKGYWPMYSQLIPFQGTGTPVARLKNAVYQPVSKLYSSQPTLPNEIEPSVSIGYDKKRPMAYVTMVPLRINAETGQWERLVSADIVVEPVVDNSTAAVQKRSAGSANYATASVLSTGSWYKMRVSQTGIHKIDYETLKELGIDADNIDPRKLHIYGNGGGYLPEANAVPRHDDLVENPIVVIGENDGKFNTSDYVLFYAQGPSLWRYDDSTGTFYYDMNPYDTYNYYFITVNGQNGKRVSSQPSAGTANVSTTSFDSYANHELEEVNFIRSGREWFGDYFNFSTTNREFKLNLPGIVSGEPLTITTEVASRSGGTGCQFPVNVNGTTLYTHVTSPTFSDYTSRYASINRQTATFNASGSQVGVTISFQNASSSAEGWLNYIELNARSNLSFNGNQLQFRDSRTIGAGNITEFVITGAADQIWDVTDPTNAQSQQFSNSGGMRFTTATDVLKEFVAFNYSGNFPKPEAVGAVANQNLHGVLAQPDYVIVTTAELMTEANRLATHHRNNNGLRVAVLDVAQIYNEFSSGRQDITAIRDLLKMLYEKAGNDDTALPRYLLLFGDGSYDYRNIMGNNQNHVPTYESVESNSPITSYCTDDYYGFLDDNEGGNIESSVPLMDVAIGRLPVANLSEASIVVDKIIHYESTETFGSWRNSITFVADDEDGNLHLNDADDLARQVQNIDGVYNIDKIYFDAFKQVSTPAGTRYPDVKAAINRKIFTGTLIMNYVGHGGTNGWALERVLDIDDIRSWDNYDKMPLFMTATCEFTRFDDPGKVSAGEEVLMNPRGGGIGLVTTSRLVFSSANKATNTNFLDKVFELYEGERMPTVGEAATEAKNALTSNALNARKFALIGDPAMTLNYPKLDVVTTSINGGTNLEDTISALETVTITGEVLDATGNRMTSFNGVVYPTIYDKPQTLQTLANDAGSGKRGFELQKNIIFRGKASVENGAFSFTFIVPKDISFNYGKGKISYYVDNGIIDGHGFLADMFIGGTADDFAADNTGPDLEVFMNDTNFVFGGLTSSDPLLLVRLYDLHGINTTGNGIGHDITAVLDGDTKGTLVLNDFYESNVDDYRSGIVLFPMADIAPGRHRIEVKAWDVYNNSAEGFTEFVVAADPCLALDKVMNFPNPMRNSTNFAFEHNKAGEPMFVQVKIFSSTGVLLKTINENFTPEGYRVNNISWDGTTDEGSQLNNGVYIYQVWVATSGCEMVKEFEKLVILR